MQAWYAARFEREMGCTPAELLRWLPGASAPHLPKVVGDAATVPIGPGRLEMAWAVLPVRQIALMRMPRLAVSFKFEGVAEADRQAFMRFFDLYTQRGGG
jgi:hypothetical protein